MAAGIYLWHLITIGGRLQGTPAADVNFQGPVLRAVIALIVITILAHILFAIITGSPDTEEDQRDRQVARFGDWVGMWPLVLGAASAMILAMLNVQHFWIANAIYAGSSSRASPAP